MKDIIQPGVQSYRHTLMTEERLYKRLKCIVEEGNCFNYNTHDLLMEYKLQGGTQDEAQQLVAQLAENFKDDQVLQDKAYDILDIITGWCGSNFIVWNHSA